MLFTPYDISTHRTVYMYITAVPVSYANVVTLRKIYVNEDHSGPLDTGRRKWRHQGFTWNCSFDADNATGDTLCLLTNRLGIISAGFGLKDNNDEQPMNERWILVAKKFVHKTQSVYSATAGLLAIEVAGLISKGSEHSPNSCV